MKATTRRRQRKPTDLTNPRRKRKHWRTIVIDPPWRYRVANLPPTSRQLLTGKRSRAAADHYPTLTIRDLEALPVGDWAFPDAHLYIWAPNAFVVEAHRLARAWGFDPKTLLTWVKPRIGMGNYWRNNTEQVVFAVRGKCPMMMDPATERIKKYPTAFYGAVDQLDAGRHSAKPQAFYDLVEAVSPGPHIDLFARRARLGWDVAGNEVYSAIDELGAK